MTLPQKLAELRAYSSIKDIGYDPELKAFTKISGDRQIILKLCDALDLAIEQRDDALNWAVNDDRGCVIHELAPERNKAIEEKLGL